MVANPEVIAQATRDERTGLARMIIRLFDAWQLSGADRAVLLGLSTRNRAALAGYRRGEPMGRSQDRLQRASYLLGIHKSLRLMFPHDLDLVYTWPTTPNRKLGGMSPVEFIRDNGLVGMAAIRAMLDFERGR